jgi:hypothetical protein
MTAERDADLVNAMDLVRDHVVVVEEIAEQWPITLSRAIAAALAEARREGAEQMRERAAAIAQERALLFARQVGETTAQPSYYTAKDIAAAAIRALPPED